MLDFSTYTQHTRTLDIHGCFARWKFPEAICCVFLISLYSGGVFCISSATLFAVFAFNLLQVNGQAESIHQQATPSVHSGKCRFHCPRQWSDLEFNALSLSLLERERCRLALTTWMMPPILTHPGPWRLLELLVTARLTHGYMSTAPGQSITKNCDEYTRINGLCGVSSTLPDREMFTYLLACGRQEQAKPPIA